MLRSRTPTPEGKGTFDLGICPLLTAANQLEISRFQAVKNLRLLSPIKTADLCMFIHHRRSPRIGASRFSRQVFAMSFSSTTYTWQTWHVKLQENVLAIQKPSKGDNNEFMMCIAILAEMQATVASLQQSLATHKCTANKNTETMRHQLLVCGVKELHKMCREAEHHFNCLVDLEEEYQQYHHKIIKGWDSLMESCKAFESWTSSLFRGIQYYTTATVKLMPAQKAQLMWNNAICVHCTEANMIFHNDSVFPLELQSRVPVPLVHPSWIGHSVLAGKRQDISKYRLDDCFCSVFALFAGAVELQCLLQTNEGTALHRFNDVRITHLIIVDARSNLEEALRDAGCPIEFVSPEFIYNWFHAKTPSRSPMPVLNPPADLSPLESIYYQQVCERFLIDDEKEHGEEGAIPGDTGDTVQNNSPVHFQYILRIC
ncbi:hypothetical protein C8R46DRAFT_1223989 [Mycena filopes]|nr:hypothetical protein C8R46DRAFT_1223989 [Mycena filopes]